MFFSPSGEVAGVPRSAESFLVALCNVHVNSAQLATLLIRVYILFGLASSLSNLPSFTFTV